MHFPIPSFVPVPSPETMQILSIVSLIVGIFLVGVAALFLFIGREKAKGKRSKLTWISMGVGALLILNHGIQLLF